MADIQFNITVKGEDYPCLLTMGVHQDFKRATGKELSEADEDTVLTAVYFCAKSVAVREGNKLPWTLEQFPYYLSMEEGAAAIGAWIKALTGQDADTIVDESKKKM